MAKFTKKAIRHSMLELLQKKELNKISVRDICELCGITRNTFYYYYSDIYQVIEELLKTETDNVIIKELGCDDNFYEEFLRRYYLILEYRQAILHLYESKNRDMVSKYFYDVTENFVNKYVIKEVGEIRLSEDDISFITDFYTNSIIGTMFKWLQGGMKNSQEQLINRLSLAYQATIKSLISELESRE